MFIDPGLRNTTIGSTRISRIDIAKGDIFIRSKYLSELIESESYYSYVSFLLSDDQNVSIQQSELQNCYSRGAEWASEFVQSITDLKNRHPMSILGSAFGMLSRSPHISPNKITEQELAFTLIGFGFEIFERWLSARVGFSSKSQIKELSPPSRLIFIMNDEMPSRKMQKIIDKCFILISEHGANNSTFTARVVASTEADTPACISAATASFSGPLHGGAVELTFKQLEKLTTSGNVKSAAKAYVDDTINAGRKIMGFGHGFYKDHDPRSKHFKTMLMELYEQDEKNYISAALELEEAMRPLQAKGIYPNCDLYSCVVYHLLGFHSESFNALHTLSRLPGWLAHINEQRREGILFRPHLEFRITDS
jgi:citrate synthase